MEDTGNKKFYWNEFLEDLEHAKQQEYYVRKLFEEIGWTFVRFNSNDEYDILMIDKKGIERKIEVKSDDQTYYKPNIIFEFQSRGKKSCISVTKSDYFVYVMPKLGLVWFIKTQPLKDLIKKYNPELLPESPDTWNMVAGGNGKTSRCYRWNRKVFARLIGNDCRIIKRYDIPV